MHRHPRRGAIFDRAQNVQANGQAAFAHANLGQHAAFGEGGESAALFVIRLKNDQGGALPAHPIPILRKPCVAICTAQSIDAQGRAFAFLPNVFQSVIAFSF